MFDKLIELLNGAAFVIGWGFLWATAIGIVLIGFPDGGVKGVTSFTWYDWGVVVIRNPELEVNMRAAGYRLRRIGGAAFGISRPRWFTLLVRAGMQLLRKS